MLPIHWYKVISNNLCIEYSSYIQIDAHRNFFSLVLLIFSVVRTNFYSFNHFVRCA